MFPFQSAQVNSLSIFSFIIEELLESKGEAARISNIDIEILTELLSFLEPFTVAIRELESDTLPTVPFIVPWLYSLKNHCMNEDGGPEIRPLKTRALEYLLEKFEIDMTHKFATALHPLFRNLRMLTDLEREEVWEEMEKIVPSSIDPVNTAKEPATKKLKVDVQDWMDVSEDSSFDTERQLYIHRRILKEETEDLLKWWKNNAAEFPKLSRTARQILVIPASSASSERNFSSAGQVISERRKCLSPVNVDSILLHDCYSKEQ